MCDIPIITIGRAIITPTIVEVIADLQSSENDDLNSLLESIRRLKDFLINLNGTDNEPTKILDYLSDVQCIEKYLLNFKP